MMIFNDAPEGPPGPPGIPDMEMSDFIDMLTRKLYAINNPSPIYIPKRKKFKKKGYRRK